MDEKQETKKTKQQCCRFCHPSIRKNEIEWHCVVNGWEDENVKTVQEADCAACGRFDSKYITYPLTIQDIETSPIETNGRHDVGCLCEISPCAEEYGGKSYVGFYLGDLPMQILSSYDRKTGILKNSTMNNPAIFVPELKKIIYGCESFWREISNIEDFKGISKEDIENTWYVAILKSMSNSDASKNGKDE